MARRKNISKQTQRLLMALFETPGQWWYGYELSKLTGLKSGTLYPILMRLDDQGYLASEWRDPDLPGKPARHVYRLTSEGKALAAQIETTIDANNIGLAQGEVTP
ncbi:MAG: helix-turn-helix transcriptional regulator [Parvularculaceae bacterium]